MRISTNGRCSIICTVGACRGEIHMKDSVANNVKSPDNRKTPDKKIYLIIKQYLLMESHPLVRAERTRWA